ncbi:hypothetical protein E2C01_004279 [Portunus trituberculatus]|uniref:Uncharacterized protein n=1 Tax=Portunus trituberculatus TaxID=210409 RepID=A0A5B7CQ56_PORTR|nr:hypothetical protein [Portunus trituberculatus]
MGVPGGASAAPSCVTARQERESGGNHIVFVLPTVIINRLPEISLQTTPISDGISRKQGDCGLREHLTIAGVATGQGQQKMIKKTPLCCQFPKKPRMYLSEPLV